MNKQMTLKIRVDSYPDRSDLLAVLARNGFWVTEEKKPNTWNGTKGHYEDRHFVLVKGEFEVVEGLE